MSRAPDEDLLGDTIAGEPAPVVEAQATLPQLGQRYRVLARLGEGGMGTVYLAVDEALGVEVALKVLGRGAGGRGASSTGGLVELRDEVLLAQRVTHENVCRTWDLEELGGQWVLKMEYVRGETLAARLARVGRLPLAEVLAIARQLVEGIDASHRKGVIHRDLKPGNILVEEGTGRVVIMDFGIARSSTRRDDRVIGTPHYMAPEQARGGHADARSDLYSLGCVIYEMLVGEVLFPSDTVGASVLRHAQDPPPDVRARVPEAPAWLARLVLSLVEKDPERRPPDARAVATLLAGPRWTPEIRQLRAYSENSDRPALSPDGTRVAYKSDRERRDHFRLYVEAVAGGPSRAITPPEWQVVDAVWSTSGRSILCVIGDGRALRLDPSALADATAPLLAEGVTSAVECADGLLLLRPSGGGTRFVVRGASGDERELHTSPTPVETVRCDATGRRAVFARIVGSGPHPPADLWLLELDGGAVRPLTHDGLENSRAVFHPDGKSVLFSSSRAGQLNLWEVTLDGAPPVPVTTGFGPDDSPTVSADGRLLHYNIDAGSAQLFALSEGALRAISPGGRQDFAFPAVSPDGGDVVAIVTPWGRPSRVVVVHLEDLEARDLGEGTAAVFHPDGRDVLYATGREVRAVPRDGGESRLAHRLDGEVVEIAVAVGADDEAALHLTLRVAHGLEAWRVDAAGRASREAPAPIALVLPAPTGGWRAAIVPDGERSRVRLLPPGAAVDDATARELPAALGRVAWRADGQALYHVVGAALLCTQVATGASTRVATGDFRHGFAVSPDGATIYRTMITPHVQRQLITNFGDRARPE